MFRMSANVRVQGCAFNGGGDATGFLASEHLLVRDTLSTNTINAAFDYWDGVKDVRVENSIAFLSKGYGISFNAVDTDGSARTSSGLVAIGNTIRGAGNDAPAIYVDPLGTTGSRITGKITIQNNTISSPQPNARTGGIFISTGDAEAVLIQGNRISGSRQYPAILVTGYRGSAGNKAEGRPAMTTITANTLEDNLVAPEHGGVVRAEGTEVQVSGNVARGNGASSGAPIPFLRSTGRVHAWDNQLNGGSPNAGAFNVPPANLVQHAP